MTAPTPPEDKRDKDQDCCPEFVEAIDRVGDKLDTLRDDFISAVDRLNESMSSPSGGGGGGGGGGGTTTTTTTTINVAGMQSALGQLQKQLNTLATGIGQSPILQFLQGRQIQGLQSELSQLTNNFKAAAAELASGNVDPARMKELESEMSKYSSKITEINAELGNAHASLIRNAELLKMAEVIYKMANEGIQRAAKLSITAQEGVAQEFKNQAAAISSIFTLDVNRMVSKEQLYSVQESVVNSLGGLRDGLELNAGGIENIVADMRTGLRSQIIPTQESFKTLAFMGLRPTIEDMNKLREATGRAALGAAQMDVLNKNRQALLIFGMQVSKTALDLDRVGVSLNTLLQGAESYVSNLEGGLDAVNQLNQLGTNIDFGQLSQLMEFDPAEGQKYLASQVSNEQMQSSSFRALLKAIPGADIDTIQSIKGMKPLEEQLESAATQQKKGKDALDLMSSAAAWVTKALGILNSTILPSIGSFVLTMLTVIKLRSSLVLLDTAITKVATRAMLPVGGVAGVAGAAGTVGTSGAAAAAGAGARAAPPLQNWPAGKVATPATGAIGGAGLTGMASGLAALANPMTLAAIAVLTLAIIGVGYALKIAAPGIEAFGSALGMVITSIGTAFSSVIGAVADGVSKAFTSIKELSPVQVIALAGSMIALGFAAAKLGISLTALASPVALLGLAAITAAVIGVGYALGLAAPGIEALGTALKSALEGVAPIVASMKELSPMQIVALAGSMVALGYAVSGLGIGATLGVVGLGILAFTIVKLAESSTGMAVLANSFKNLSTNIKELNGIDLSKVKELSKIAQDAAVGPAFTDRFKNMFSVVPTAASGATAKPSPAQMNDGFGEPETKGGRVLTTGAGEFKLNPNDYFIAGTALGQDSKVDKLQPVMDKLDKLVEARTAADTSAGLAQVAASLKDAVTIVTSTPKPTAPPVTPVISAINAKPDPTVDTTSLASTVNALTPSLNSITTAAQRLELLSAALSPTEVFSAGAAVFKNITIPAPPAPTTDLTPVTAKLDAIKDMPPRPVVPTAPPAETNALMKKLDSFSDMGIRIELSKSTADSEPPPPPQIEPMRANFTLNTSELASIGTEILRPISAAKVKMDAEPLVTALNPLAGAARDAGTPKLDQPQATSDDATAAASTQVMTVMNALIKKVDTLVEGISNATTTIDVGGQQEMVLSRFKVAKVKFRDQQYESI